MFNAKAGIILVLKHGDDKEKLVSANLAHELGYLDAQGKPVLLLVEQGCEHELFEEFSNSDGRGRSIFVAKFGNYASNDADGLARIVRDWIAGWKHVEHAMPPEDDDSQYGFA
jgi:nucleoside 2-deoxyribosyltransferase